MALWTHQYRLSLIAQMTRKMLENTHQLPPVILEESLKRINAIALRSDHALENDEEAIMNGAKASSIKLEPPKFGY